MRCTKRIAALAAFAVPSVSAASIADLPSCALKAASSGVADTGCMTTDYRCLCSATSFLTSLQTQVMAECNPGDYQATLSFAQGICGSVGITLNLPAPNQASTAAAAAPAAPANGQATTAAPAATSAGSGADDSDEDTHTPATDAAVTSSWGPDAASTSTAIVSAISTPSLSPPDTDSTSSSLWTSSASSPSLSLSAQSYLVQLAAPTDISVPSSQISTTTACTNGSANRTVSTSAPLAFEGKAPGRRLQWASAALMVGVVAAFVAL